MAIERTKKSAHKKPRNLLAEILKRVKNAKQGPFDPSTVNVRVVYDEHGKAQVVPREHPMTQEEFDALIAKIEDEERDV